MNRQEYDDAVRETVEMAKAGNEFLEPERLDELMEEIHKYEEENNLQARAADPRDVCYFVMYKFDDHWGVMVNENGMALGAPDQAKVIEVINQHYADIPDFMKEMISDETFPRVVGLTMAEYIQGTYHRPIQSSCVVGEFYTFPVKDNATARKWWESGIVCGK